MSGVSDEAALLGMGVSGPLRLDDAGVAGIGLSSDSFLE